MLLIFFLVLYILHLMLGYLRVFQLLDNTCFCWDDYDYNFSSLLQIFFFKFCRFLLFLVIYMVLIAVCWSSNLSEKTRFFLVIIQQNAILQYCSFKIYDYNFSSLLWIFFFKFNRFILFLVVGMLLIVVFNLLFLMRKLDSFLLLFSRTPNCSIARSKLISLLLCYC